MSKTIAEFPFISREKREKSDFFSLIHTVYLTVHSKIFASTVLLNLATYDFLQNICKTLQEKLEDSLYTLHTPSHNYSHKLSYQLNTDFA